MYLDCTSNITGSSLGGPELQVWVWERKVVVVVGNLHGKCFNTGWFTIPTSLQIHVLVPLPTHRYRNRNKILIIRTFPTEAILMQLCQKSILRTVICNALDKTL